MLSEKFTSLNFQYGIAGAIGGSWTLTPLTGTTYQSGGTITMQISNSEGIAVSYYWEITNTSGSLVYGSATSTTNNSGIDTFSTQLRSWFNTTVRVRAYSDATKQTTLAVVNYTLAQATFGFDHKTANVNTLTAFNPGTAQLYLTANTDIPTPQDANIEVVGQVNGLLATQTISAGTDLGASSLTVGHRRVGLFPTIVVIPANETQLTLRFLNGTTLVYSKNVAVTQTTFTFAGNNSSFRYNQITGQSVTYSTTLSTVTIEARYTGNVNGILFSQSYTTNNASDSLPDCPNILDGDTSVTLGLYSGTTLLGSKTISITEVTGSIGGTTLFGTGAVASGQTLNITSPGINGINFTYNYIGNVTGSLGSGSFLVSGTSTAIPNSTSIVTNADTNIVVNVFRPNGSLFATATRAVNNIPNLTWTISLDTVRTHMGESQTITVDQTPKTNNGDSYQIQFVVPGETYSNINGTNAANAQLYDFTLYSFQKIDRPLTINIVYFSTVVATLNTTLRENGIFGTSSIYDGLLTHRINAYNHFPGKPGFFNKDNISETLAPASSGVNNPLQLHTTPPAFALFHYRTASTSTHTYSTVNVTSGITCLGRFTISNSTQTSLSSYVGNSDAATYRRVGVVFISSVPNLQMVLRQANSLVQTVNIPLNSITNSDDFGVVAEFNDTTQTLRVWINGLLVNTTAYSSNITSVLTAWSFSTTIHLGASISFGNGLLLPFLLSTQQRDAVWLGASGTESQLRYLRRHHFELNKASMGLMISPNVRRYSGFGSVPYGYRWRSSTNSTSLGDQLFTLNSGGVPILNDGYLQTPKYWQFSGSHTTTILTDTNLSRTSYGTSPYTITFTVRRGNAGNTETLFEYLDSTATLGRIRLHYSGSSLVVTVGNVESTLPLASFSGLNQTQWNTFTIFLNTSLSAVINTATAPDVVWRNQLLSDFVAINNYTSTTALGATGQAVIGSRLDGSNKFTGDLRGVFFTKSSTSLNVNFMNNFIVPVSGTPNTLSYNKICAGMLIQYALGQEEGILASNPTYTEAVTNGGKGFVI